MKAILITFTIGLLILISYPALCQQDTVQPGTNTKSIDKDPDHSKVLLDTSFNPGTKKGDSLLYNRKKMNKSKSDKTTKGKNNASKNKTQIRPRPDTIHRAK